MVLVGRRGSELEFAPFHSATVDTAYLPAGLKPRRAYVLLPEVAPGEDNRQSEEGECQTQIYRMGPML